MYRIHIPSIPHRVFFCFLIGLFSLKASAQQSTTHGLWVWKTSAVLATPGSAESLRKFCRAQQINEVYVSFSSTGGAQGRAAEDALLSNVIHELHKSSIRVEALLSSTDADEAGKPREKLLGHIREVVKFNRSHPNSTFDGIHLDIEPQQRPENKGPGNLNFLPGLVEAYRAARALATQANLTINADIQIKLLKGDLKQRRSLLTSLPRLTLMLYELSSLTDGATPEQKQEKLLNKSKEAIDTAYQGLAETDLAKLAIGLRTPDYEQLMPRMFEAVDDSLHTNPHYSGWAWHSWNEESHP
jgi:hypothetical protein